MTFSSFFSSLVETIHADAPEEQKVSVADSQDGDSADAQSEPEEEEEPEDVCSLLFFLLVGVVAEPRFLNPQIHPTLREEAQESSKCKAATQHFLHCQEKVQSGKGFKHEDCVEEM
jgi:ubiquinol-cytochrome c reductase subunit 6